MIRLFFIISESLQDAVKNFLFPFLPFPMKIEEDELHLQKTIDWLVEAVNNGKGGVSSHYSLVHGKWLYPFPETTGYIIPTFFDYSKFIKNKNYYNIAIKLADWLCDVQLDNGGCMQGMYNEKKGKTKPIIFNTGQNIFGFLRAYEETNDKKYLDSAVKAGNFLIKSTDDSGLWNQHLHRNLKHTINSRTAWALLLLNSFVSDESYVRVAKANLDWVLKQQIDNGWFRNGASREGSVPNTHFLSYTCEGLIGAYKILNEEKYLQAAVNTGLKMLQIFETRKMLYAFWNENWKNRGKLSAASKGKFVCVTGNIQISSVWMDLYLLIGDIRYVNAAFKMIDYVKTLHKINQSDKNINGAVKGSFPLYGDYSRLMYPNWAAKFFADALMMKIDLKKKILEELKVK